MENELDVRGKKRNTIRNFNRGRQKSLKSEYLTTVIPFRLVIMKENCEAHL